jgi:hypothetical protein
MAGDWLFGNMFTDIYASFAGGGPPSASSLVPFDVANMAAGSTLTYARRTSDMVSLNIAGKGGLPHALGGAAPSTFKSFLGTVGDILNLGMELVDRLEIDAALFNAEAVYCGLNH